MHCLFFFWNRTRSLAVPMIIEKSFASVRSGTRAKALDLLLMYIEIENKGDAVVVRI
jgi:cytoskeleton-associated protein 5